MSGGTTIDPKDEALAGMPPSEPVIANGNGNGHGVHAGNGNGHEVHAGNGNGV
ncbi:MAG: hypothetical protein JO021_11970, partial [Alphaproteobacteria bacterium]|nr:hypothetical protein [Alphaproteobacteria bacterium]